MTAAEAGPYAGLSAYGIAVTALERILGLDGGGPYDSWDEARAIASEAHGLAVAAAAQPAPELAAAMAETPGQVAYEGFVAFQEPDGFEYETWADKDERGDSAVMGRADWEAAGQALLTRGWPRAAQTAAQLDRLRDRLATLAAALDSDALATHPSKKSQIQADAARRIREALA